MTTAFNQNKTIRRNFIALWAGQAHDLSADECYEECDRIIIAMHRFQTEGKLLYRQQIGMHGGGGGTSSQNFKALLTEKMNADIKTHYNGVFPSEGYWPDANAAGEEPALNSTKPQKITEDNPNRAFAYSFCWHAEPQFIVWHRALCAEFERNYQTFDPKQEGHVGRAALGLPYWSWEEWDGLTLPSQITLPYYTIKTNKWVGYAQGTSIPNPFYRWFAPVSIEDQIQEKFPPSLDTSNCTVRANYFNDPVVSIPVAVPWQIIPGKFNNPSMRDVVHYSIGNKVWNEFCTVKPDYGGGKLSIENAHNKFHNHIGGIMNAGDFVYTGTMTQNQSIFDPVFWLHHSNVERQLCSWQNKWNVPNPDPLSVPSPELMNTVLYPWTKPDSVAQGKMSYNTSLGSGDDATFADWFNADTTYVYDHFIDPVPPTFLAAVDDTPMLMFTKALLPHATESAVYNERKAVRITVYIDPADYRSGEYQLWHNGSLVDTISILSVQGGVCARCKARSSAGEAGIDFFVLPPIHMDFSVLNKFSLRRNGKTAVALLRITNDNASSSNEEKAVTKTSKKRNADGMSNQHAKTARR